MMIRVVKGPNFRFHPRCEAIGITHQAYADDLLLFVKGDIGSVLAIRNALDEFGCYLGLRTNLDKSLIFVAGVQKDVIDSFVDITSFSKGSFLFRCLGIPHATQKHRASDYGVLIESLMAMVQSWRRATLSYAGKLELIKSVLQGVEYFRLSILSAFWCNLRDLRAWNKSLLIEVLSDITSGKEFLWVRWVRSVYNRDRSL